MTRQEGIKGIIPRRRRWHRQAHNSAPGRLIALSRQCPHGTVSRRDDSQLRS